MFNYRKFKTSLIYISLLLSTSLSLTLPRKVAAQVVYVDGRLIQGQELAAFERQAGNKFAPGTYHIDTNTGLMNYQGPMGQAVLNLRTGQYAGYGPNGYEEGNIYQNAASGNPSSGGHGYIGRDGNVYDPRTNSSAIRDPNSGCTYFTVGGYTINSCDKNW